MIRNTIAAAAIGLLAALPLSIQASQAQGMDGFHHAGPDGMHGDQGHFLMMLRAANLSAAQQTQVHAILNANRAQMMSLRQQLAGLHEKLADKLLSPGSVSASDLKPLVDQTSRLETTLNQNATETAVSIRNILTPAQIEKLAQMHAKLRNIHRQIQGLMGHGDVTSTDDN